ncbi:MAG TPA: MotA/TolQ/ExbB proton channel family protein [Bacteroidales bacterium]|nr:MotA/TolQ/ExbB proton channel family protein [Bacteroidales bacterium]
MRKFFSLLTVVGLLTFGATNWVMGQTTQVQQATNTQMVDDTTQPAVEQPAAVQADTAAAEMAVPEEKGLHQVFKTKFIEGGVPWMTPILILLIIGLAIVIERIIYLNMATTNTEKLLQKVEEALKTGGIEAAKEVCRNTRGPVASIFYQGLDRYDQGLDVVEKSIVSYGSVQSSSLERGLTWISLAIALAPMLGFLGTVVGMVGAFDAIEVAGDISPTIVAGGIKVALLTTIFGLIVAIILQVFYNYLVSKIESLVSAMEDSSISMMDILVHFQRNK